MTQAEFLRNLGENTQSNSLKSFMALGPLKMSGASNKVYRLAYHFLEKVRLAENKPKSKKRIQNEKELKNEGAKGGYQLTHDTGLRWCSADSRPVLRGDKIVFM